MDPDLQRQILDVIPPDQLVARARAVGMTPEAYMAAIVQTITTPGEEDTEHVREEDRRIAGGSTVGMTPGFAKVRPKRSGPKRWKPAKARPR